MQVKSQNQLEHDFTYLLFYLPKQRDLSYINIYFICIERLPFVLQQINLSVWHKYHIYRTKKLLVKRIIHILKKGDNYGELNYG